MAEIWSDANTALLPSGSWVPVGGLLATRLKSNIWASGHILTGMSSWTKISLFPSTQLPRVMKDAEPLSCFPVLGGSVTYVHVQLEAAPDWQARDPTSISGLIYILGWDTWTFLLLCLHKAQSFNLTICITPFSAESEYSEAHREHKLQFNSEVNQEEEGVRAMPSSPAFPANDKWPMRGRRGQMGVRQGSLMYFTSQHHIPGLCNTVY